MLFFFSGFVRIFIDMVIRALSVILLLVMTAAASHVAVLETGTDESAREKVSFSDRQYLTNVLREEAVKELPAALNYTIMTRENISAMLPPGKALEDCEGTCLAETGRNIAADYICQARVGVFGASLTLSAELYETAGNKLVASFNGLGKNVEELLEIIKQKSPEFFRKVKGGFGFTGIGVDLGGGSQIFDIETKQKFIVEIVSNPTGAVPTIDGRANPKCLSTPCKVLVDGGRHRIMASMEKRVTADTVVDIKKNGQKVELELPSNIGWLEVSPTMDKSVAPRGRMDVSVDGSVVRGIKIPLEEGIHEVRVTHTCYDPVSFKVAITRNRTEVFNRKMERGEGGLDLKARYQGVMQAVPVYVDGVRVGVTPYKRKIPLCSNVQLRGKDWSEIVDAHPKWHKVVHITHELKHDPSEGRAGDSVAVKLPSKDSSAYDDELQEVDVGDISGEQEPSKKWRVLGLVVSSVVFVAGTVMAAVGNSKASEAARASYYSEEEYEEKLSDAKSGQTLRNVGVGAMIAGSVGLVISFSF